MLYPNCADAQVCLSILLLAYSMCTKISCASFHFRSMFGQKSYQCMALLYLLLYDVFVQSTDTRSADFWDRIVEDSYVYSPYNDFCNRTEPEPEKPEPRRLCTAPCSCDVVHCREKSECCPDVLQHRIQKEHVNTSCLYPVVHSEHLDTWNNPRFHVDFPLKMVTGCLRNYTGSELHQQCLIYRNITNLDNMVPVLSTATGVIYVNRFCADCNGVKTYEPFESIFVCSTEMFTPWNWDLLVKERTPQSQQELIETKLCNYIFRPPNGSTIDGNQCAEYMYHACNQTGAWDYFDQFLVDACDAYELPHFYSKNLHCYICNERRDFVQLSDQKYRINAFCPHIKVSVLQISFYAIIDVDLNRLREIDFSQLAKQTGDHECGDYPGEVPDPYMVNIRNTDTLANFPPFTTDVIYYILSHDVASGSEITPSNKIDKPLVVYRFSGNVMASITTLHT